MLSTYGAVAGASFLAWSFVAGASDNILRPLLLSRGCDVPFAVILIGTIGGLLDHGLLGLFVGPVAFALGYRLFNAWVARARPSPSRRSVRANKIQAEVPPSKSGLGVCSAEVVAFEQKW